VADQTGSRIGTEGAGAAVHEAGRVGIATRRAGLVGRAALGGRGAVSGAPAADRRRRVAGGAVTFGMAAHAGVQVALCLPRMVRARTWPLRPPIFGRMEAPPRREVRDRARQRDPCSLVTVEAERLLAVAAGAGGIVLPSSDGMHADPVVRVHPARADAAVMATRAKALAMTVGAEPALVGCHALVSLDPIGSVLRVVQPGRRQELPAGKLRLQHAALLAQVTRGARARGFTLTRRGVLVTLETSPHARQLVGRRELEVLDATMTALAAHTASNVQRVVEAQVGFGDVEACHC